MMSGGPHQPDAQAKDKRVPFAGASGWWGSPGLSRKPPQPQFRFFPPAPAGCRATGRRSGRAAAAVWKGGSTVGKSIRDRGCVMRLRTLLAVAMVLGLGAAAPRAARADGDAPELMG